MRLLYVILLTSSTYLSNAQDIQGTYQEKGVTGEVTRTITFNKDSFKEQFTGDLQTKLGFGNYSFKNNIFVLNYKLYPKQDSSSYELLDLRPSLNSNIELAILDADSIPMFGYYGCRDVKDSALNIVNTDKNGIGNITIFNNKNIGYFTIDCIGYHRISIPIKKLVNKQVKIKAYLKPQINNYIEPRTEIYKVIKITNKQLILSRRDKISNFERVQ